MIERPILFNGEMVRAILERRKTQTRRVCKPMFDGGAPYCVSEDGRLLYDDNPWREIDSPYGKPGDRLWVRENVSLSHMNGDDARLRYDADGSIIQVGPNSGDIPDDKLSRYFDWLDKSRAKDDAWVVRPSIHMPRWASRISLEVTDVRVERLQEIGEEDAICEGVKRHGPGYYPYGYSGMLYIGANADVPALCCPTAIGSFERLWDSIYKDKGFGWQENPWVWVVSFRNLAGEGE